MNVIYDIDENCRNLRKLAIALKPIHKRFGVDIKLGTSETDLTEETHFFDKDLYREAYKNSSSDFLITNWNDIEFYPKTTISEECKKQFARKVAYYGEHPDEMPQNVEDSVRLQLHRLMRRLAPDLLAKMTSYVPAVQTGERLTREMEIEQAYEIDIKLDPSHPRLNEIILAAFHNSPAFLGMAMNEPDVKDLFRDSADKEKRLLLSDSFFEQGEKEKTNYVIVTGDIRHAEQLKNIVNDEKIGDGYSRKERSFVMLPEDFVASCQAIHHLLSSKLSKKTDSLRAELDTLGKAIDAASTQYDGKINKTYCQMVTNNRYKDWGISIQRY